MIRIALLAALLAALPLTGCSGARVEAPPGQALGATTAAAVGAVAETAETAALAPFYRRLAALEGGGQRTPLVILQFGDSHTAGDRFSGRLRDRFQARFGAAGRGTLPPGVPFDYYRPTLVSAAQTGEWSVANSLRADAGGLFGISGFRATSDDPDAAMTLTSEEPGGFHRAEVVVVNRPGGGTLLVEVDGRRVHELPTAGSAERAARLDLPVAGGGRTLTLRPAGDGPVSVLSWTIEREEAGVVYDSHGIVASTVAVMDRWEPRTVGWEIGHRDPALVVLAYGTNEGFDDGLDAAAYARGFAARLAALRAAAPNAAILVVGPPDANRLPGGCDRAGATCAVDGSAQCRWAPPPNLAVVRTLQAEAAARQGAHFWDWSAVMGGACGTHRWTAADPPLAYDDHVHLRTEGYHRSADALFDALMDGYDRFRAAGGVAEHRRL